MEKIVLVGGKPLKGDITISGAKNAALPLLATTLLTDEEVTLTNVPNLSDITQMLALLTQLGTEIDYHPEKKSCSLKTGSIKNEKAPYDIVRKMRASILVLGPLLARHGKASVSLPGGCAIGTRPVGVHVEGLRALGADITIENGYIQASCQKLMGAEIQMSVVSVTGTENLLMAATLAQGRTILRNAAKEPEIEDLARCLCEMGANIEGIGTDTLIIDGVESLNGVKHTIIPDRIETATYALGAAITHGDVVLHNSSYEDLSLFWDCLRKAGGTVSLKDSNDHSTIQVQMTQDIQSVDIVTAPYPGFPTDLQAQFMALMTLCVSASSITETIFENRFMHVSELMRMGADISIHQSSALVRGVPKLMGAPVMATDIRASASLVLAGMAAKGTTEINRIYHLDRGYEKIEEKLGPCGIEIWRESIS